MERIKRLAAVLGILLCFVTLSAFSGGDQSEPLPGKVNTSWADTERPEASWKGDASGKGASEDVTDASDDGWTLTGGMEPADTDKALTPEGNLTLVDDTTGGRERDFLTVTTRNGHYFYLIVDRAKNGENTVHFLNQVDESDLLPLIEDADAEKEPVTCSCSERCYPGHVDVSCPVCAVNMSECVGKEPEPPSPEEPEKETEKAEPEPRGKSVPLRQILTAVVSLSVVLGGGTVYFLKFRKKKQDTRGSADLEEYDYGEDEEEEREEDKADSLREDDL